MNKLHKFFTTSIFIQTINIKIIKGAIHYIIPFLKRIRRSNYFCSFNKGFN